MCGATSHTAYTQTTLNYLHKNRSRGNLRQVLTYQPSGHSVHRTISYLRFFGIRNCTTLSERTTCVHKSFVASEICINSQHGGLNYPFLSSESEYYFLEKVRGNVLVDYPTVEHVYNVFFAEFSGARKLTTRRRQTAFVDCS